MEKDYQNVLTRQDEAVVRMLSTIRKACWKAERLFSDYHLILNGERFLTDAEVAGHLRVSRRTLQEYRNDGILPYVEMKGKVVYRESDIENALKRHYHKGRFVLRSIQG